jgi:sterol carrier protein 2
LCWHLRGWANNRLAKGTKVCLQHNLGLGGAVVVTVYKRADGKEATPVSSEEVAKKTGLGMSTSLRQLFSFLIKIQGYNPAVEAKGFTTEQADRVRSQNKRSDWALQDIQHKVQARF